MQLALYFECDDDITPEQLRTALRQMAIDAASDALEKGIPKVDGEHHINVNMLPYIWSAQLCRHQ
jgi:hypothetical protein